MNNFLSVSALKPERLNCTIMIAIMPARNASKTDSAMNWLINELFCAPTTFLIPTSFARFSERAVCKVHKIDACDKKNESSDNAE